MLSAFYINLDAAADRRTCLEDNVRQHGAGIALTRVPAVDVAQVQAQGVPGRIRDVEKACFLSHRKAIQMSLAVPGPALILEDDALIGPRTLAILGDLIARAGQGLDVLYAEACIVGVYDMINFFAFKKHLAKEGRIELIDLKAMEYAGAVAYVVMPHAKQRLLDLMADFRELDVPVDIWMREQVQTGQVRASLIFPFLARLSPLGQQSALRIETEKMDEMVWGAFRQMMFIGFDETTDDPTAQIRQVPDAFYDNSARYFADILKLFFADRFQRDWSGAQ